MTAAVALAAVLAAPQVAGAAPQDKQQVFDFATETPVAGAFSKLNRGEDGITAKIRTSATGGNAHTLWFVVFNAPQNCSDGVCGEDDIFNPDGSFNIGQINAARISVLWSQGGAVARPSGQLQLNGALNEGEFPGGPNQVVIGRADDGALVGISPVTGLEDASAAEVHTVVQDHGPAQADPAMLQTQLSQFQGACNTACVDIQFAIHAP